MQQVVLESIDDALTRTFHGPFSFRLDDPRLAKQREEPVQSAPITTSGPALPTACLQKAIQHPAVQVWHRNEFLLKPLTEVGDYRNLASDRVWRVTLLGYHGGVGVKVFL
jgi:hypothetical protein